VLEAYGATPGGASFANNCLLARRLVEQNVRFVQLSTGAGIFTAPGRPRASRRLTKKCSQTDKPVAALIRDLRQRGLLDDTLIVWGGEFGRTPFREGRTAASKILGPRPLPRLLHCLPRRRRRQTRHHLRETDELGFSVVRDKVHIHDLQATILHLLGFEHEKLTFRFQGPRLPPHRCVWTSC